MERSKLDTFFKLVFGKHTGYVCIAHKGQNTMHENYFMYPDELAKMTEHIESFHLETDMYFCPQLLGSKKRNKENVQTCTNLWSDLDEANPSVLLVDPNIVIESSPKRYQAYWLLDSPITAEQAEDYSRRIAYYHAADGADKSGWDLSQLLRIPFTYNYKYDDRHQVKIRKATDNSNPADAFTVYPVPEGFEYTEVPFPTELPETSADDLLAARRHELNPNVWPLFYNTPTNDWSGALWQLEMILFEHDYSAEEVFIIAEASACNKFRRDNKPREYLWRDVCKAHDNFKKKESQLFYTAEDINAPILLTDAERKAIEASPSIIEEYVEWGKSLGDAAWQYHEAGAFVILSALLASWVRLPTSFGTVTPNVWFLILADTTLTRKTTAMDLAVDMILEIDPDSILATDGSIEGLMTSLSTRPGRASMFLRDEFSGLLEMITKKDYYAGMAEALTKLYDGKYQKRVLRKEIIEIRDPILILFAGGIRTRIYELLDYSYVTSGFLPRFLFIAADSDISRLRPLGPPTEATENRKNVLLDRYQDLWDHYSAEQVVNINGKQSVIPARWTAELTPDAWLLYNTYEATMLQTGLESERQDLLTPTMARLAVSGLKMSVLLAAAREKHKEKVIVTEEDLRRAFYYIEKWSVFTVDLIKNVGKSTSERQLERIYKSIANQPGITRSALMQNHHLNAREATLLFETLTQRGVIREVKVGKGSRYEPIK